MAIVTKAELTERSAQPAIAGNLSMTFQEIGLTAHFRASGTPAVKHAERRTFLVAECWTSLCAILLAPA